MQKLTEIEAFESVQFEQMANIGRKIHQKLTWPGCVYLEGELGAGKTTLCQAIIAAAGYSGAVTSPTYNLIQEYPVEIAAAKPAVIYHMDLYRMNEPEELYYLGIEDLWSETSLFLIEWPSKGGSSLPPADYLLSLECFDENTANKINSSRTIKFSKVT